MSQRKKFSGGTNPWSSRMTALSPLPQNNNTIIGIQRLLYGRDRRKLSPPDQAR